jgi:hypothetical protein
VVLQRNDCGVIPAAVKERDISIGFTASLSPPVLQWCFSGVLVVLQWCCSGVAMVL